MARSSGYRATKENKEEIAVLRLELSRMQVDEWVRAGLIMQEIARLSGKIIGPSGGMVRPRVCKHCKFYGHTKNYCKLRKFEEQAALDWEISQHKAWEEQAHRQHQ